MSNMIRNVVTLNGSEDEIRLLLESVQCRPGYADDPEAKDPRAYECPLFGPGTLDLRAVASLTIDPTIDITTVSQFSDLGACLFRTSKAWNQVSFTATKPAMSVASALSFARPTMTVVVAWSHPGTDELSYETFFKKGLVVVS
ncbi:MAG: hypothetical protein FWF43_01095 [Propionibacteriaceae bacterium]|nr:hypothetical protein [Propionibacteriaceae bacterium]